jgi:2-polyprenyl-3-methyl-5-hydroxy-6-metoxy-1,4-benzoquinol methylase
LAITTPPGREGTSLEPETVNYTSNLLRLLVERLDQRQEAQMLDVGLVCNDNINFLAKRVKRLYVCDMFLRLDHNRRKALPSSMIWQHLDYPAKSFDGVLLWHLISYLKDNEVRRLVDLCCNMVRPGGMVMIAGLGGQAISPVVNCFVVADHFRLYLHPRPSINLPYCTRQNREVLALLAPFVPAKSIIYRNGIREFLFQLH